MSAGYSASRNELAKPSPGVAVAGSQVSHALKALYIHKFVAVSLTMASLLFESFKFKTDIDHRFTIAADVRRT